MPAEAGQKHFIRRRYNTQISLIAKSIIKKDRDEMNRPRLCGQHKKAPGVGNMKFKRSGAALAAPLQSLSGRARGYRNEYNGQSFHWRL